MSHFEYWSRLRIGACSVAEGMSHAYFESHRHFLSHDVIGLRNPMDCLRAFHGRAGARQRHSTNHRGAATAPCCAGNRDSAINLYNPAGIGC